MLCKYMYVCVWASACVCVWVNNSRKTVKDEQDHSKFGNYEVINKHCSNVSYEIWKYGLTEAHKLEWRQTHVRVKEHPQSHINTEKHTRKKRMLTENRKLKFTYMSWPLRTHSLFKVRTLHELAARVHKTLKLSTRSN